MKIKSTFDTRRFEKRLKEIPKRIKKELPKTLKKIESHYKRSLIKNTPKDTGKAKQSWRSKVTKSLGKITLFNIAKTRGSSKNYLIYVDKGTRYITPRKFLEKTLTKEKVRIKKEFQKFLKKILNNY